MTTTRQQGFILILTLMMLSIGILLVTQLFHRGTGHYYFDGVMVTRQKAQTLALSSVELVQSQLSLISTKTVNSQEDRALLLRQALPYLNRWQTYELQEKVDGITAQIRMMVSCEQGKLNINQLFDFSKKQFKTPQIKTFMQALFARLKKFVQDKDLYPVLEKFLKEQKQPLGDVSQLLAIKEFSAAFGQRQFCVPPQKKGAGDGGKAPVYLFDIFTLWSDHDTVSAWVISDSLAAVLGLNRASAGPMATRAKLAQEITKKVDVDQQSLTVLWDSSLKKWYGKDYKALPKETDKLLSASFVPTSFSVVCHAKVGSITQKLYAIIEREFNEKKGTSEFSVKKLYWI